MSNMDKSRLHADSSSGERGARNDASDAEALENLTNLPVTGKPEWTDVDCGDGFSATFRFIGDRILLSAPSGEPGDAGMKTFLHERARVLDAMPGSQEPFVELMDHSGIASRAGGAAGARFDGAMRAERERILGLVGFNAGPPVTLSFETADFVRKTGVPLFMVDTRDDAVHTALALLKKCPEKQTPDASGQGDRGIEKRPEPVGMEVYARELVDALTHIDWESDGAGIGIEAPPSHPFRGVFDAIADVKVNLGRFFRERRRADRINNALFKISNAVNTTLNLDELYASIHRSLSDIIDVANFYIAIYNKEEDVLSFPYFVDETTKVPHHVREKTRVKDSKSLTCTVIRTGKPLIAKKDEGRKLRERDLAPRGDAAEAWLGIPLIARGEVIGAMVVQSYTDSELYDEKAVDILTSVADQAAIAIERKRAEEALLVEKAHIDRLFEAVEEGIAIADENELVLNINPEFTRLFGYSREEALGRPLHELIVPGEYADQSMDYLKRLVAGEKVNFEAWRKRKDGTRINVSVIGSPIPVDVDKVGLCAIYRDITKQRKASDTLLTLYNISRAVNSTRGLDELFELIHESLGRILDTTNFFIALYDEKADRISFPYFVDEKDEPLVTPGASEKESLTARVVKTNKSYFFSEAEFSRMHSDDGVSILGSPSKAWLGAPLSIKGKVIGAVVLQSYTDPTLFSARDIPLVESISEQIAIAIDSKRTEEARLESERRYRTLFDNAGDAIFVHDMGRVFLDVNAAACERYGYAREEFLTMSPDDIVQPDARHRTAMRIEAMRKYGQVINETVHMARNGEPLHCELNSRLIAYKGKVAVLSIARDITGRKRAEREKRRMEAKLQNARKMEAIGALAGGVAHELNNILSGLVSYPELLLMDIPRGSPLRNAILLIQRSGAKAAAIVQDLLTLARRGVVTTDPVNLNRVVSEYLESPEYYALKKYHSAVRSRVNLEPDLLTILGSPVHLSKTLMNLVSNAAEAMPEGGEIVISTKNRYLDKPVKGYDDVKAGDYITLSVSDAGTGIMPDDLERIFEPFYTKKVMGRSGTGLGMAVVWGTVKDHDGYIDIRTAEGEGTRFTLYFPISEEASPKEPAAVSTRDFMGRGETIVAVDDAPEQRMIIEGILNMLHYSVHTCSSGEEAVEYMKTRSADLLILDMIMDPGIDGLETYRRILEFHPGQKAIIVSGFSETERVREARKLGAGAYVKKPYLLKNIGPAIRNELDR